MSKSLRYRIFGTPVRAPRLSSHLMNYDVDSHDPCIHAHLSPSDSNELLYSPALELKRREEREERESEQRANHIKKQLLFGDICFGNISCRCDLCQPVHPMIRSLKGLHHKLKSSPPSLLDLPMKNEPIKTTEVIQPEREKQVIQRPARVNTRIFRSFDDQMYDITVTPKSSCSLSSNDVSPLSSEPSSPCLSASNDQLLLSLFQGELNQVDLSSQSGSTQSFNHLVRQSNNHLINRTIPTSVMIKGGVDQLQVAVMDDMVQLDSVSDNDCDIKQRISCRDRWNKFCNKIDMKITRITRLIEVKLKKRPEPM